MLSVKKELKIYRGTYEEIFKEPTEDMAIYFAWDTQEIFVGNKYGVKTPYIGGNRLSEREIRAIVASLVTDEVTLLRSQVLSTNSKAVANEDALGLLILRVEAVEGSNNEDIVNAVVAILTGDEGILNSYYTSQETDNEISTRLGNYYTKSQVDNKLPDLDLVPDFPGDYIIVKNRLSNLEIADTEYDSIKILHPSPVNEQQLLGYISTVEKGIYSFMSDEGYEILINNQNKVLRLKTDGRIYYLNNNDWPLVPIDTAIVKSINTLTTNNGSITLTLDNIADTTTKRYNSIIPQENNVVNPLGRGAGDMGEGSIAFGKDSVAEGENSIAIGLEALVTGDQAIQLGTGSNNTNNTLKFLDKEIINSDGKIPTERIIERFFEAEVTISALDWDDLSLEAQIEITGITENSLIWVSPTENSLVDYTRHNVRAILQGNGSLTFKCDYVLENEIVVNVVWRS
jgi:hypothetical protein